MSTISRTILIDEALLLALMNLSVEALPTGMTINKSNLPYFFKVKGQGSTTLFYAYATGSTISIGIGTVTPKSTFEVNGSTGIKVSTITTLESPYDAENEGVILCDATTGNIIINLPDASLCNGRLYSIKKSDNSGSLYSVTIDGFLTQKIDEVETIILSSKYQHITIVSNGSNWFII
jgi:hypothetical protein